MESDKCSNSSITVAAPSSSQPGKVTAQLTKLRDANAKYKNLLKLAKERIEQQEHELKILRAKWGGPKDLAVEDKKDDFAEVDDNTEAGVECEDVADNVVKIVQCIKVDLEAHEMNLKGGNQEIWALVEFETVNSDQIATTKSKRRKRWKRFDAESDLIDFVRRDTGEPVTIPPYSLTPQQSARIESESQKEINQVNEEFRRFRIKANMASKKAEAQIRELQNGKVESAKRRIEGRQSSEDIEDSRGVNSGIERMRAEMLQLDSQWKEAYDLLVAENESLRSSGSDAMLASQWRLRYESCLQEKEAIESKLNSIERTHSDLVDEEKYATKYRDLKESFRLYRQKAQEMFKTQQGGAASTQLWKLSEKSCEESKLSYLKNLMVNYLSSGADVREHMETAIGTVLNFSKEDIEKIERKKAEAAYWGIF